MYLRKIVFAVDFFRTIAPCGAVCALDGTPAHNGLAPRGGCAYEMPLKEVLLTRLREFAADVLPGLKAECAVVEGGAGRTIVDFSEAEGADLIGMATQGSGALRRSVPGSVTSRVLHDSRLPVWTSPHVCESSHCALPQPRLIIAGIDLKRKCERTLDAALALAQLSGAKVELLHVANEGTLSPAMGWQVERAMARVAAATSGRVSAGRRSKCRRALPACPQS